MVRSRIEAPAAARSGFRRLRRPAVLRRRAVSMVASVMAASVTVASVMAVAVMVAAVMAVGSLWIKSWLP
jgi:hypothetical protein